MGYKLKKIYIRVNNQEKQVRPAGPSNLVYDFTTSDGGWIPSSGTLRDVEEGDVETSGGVEGLRRKKNN